MNGLGKAVVVGGSSGIGEAIARELLARGAEVTIAGRDPKRLAAASERLGGTVATAALDATDRAAVDALLGGKESLDHLVLSFGAAPVQGLFTDLSMAALTKALSGKLVAYLSVLQAALPSLRANGSVTFLGAVHAGAAMPGTAGLAAANGGLHAAVPPLARELAPLRVNAVAPGVIETPYWERSPEPARARVFQYAADGPAGRVGSPEDVAQVVAMLIQDSYVTGAVVPCDGGLRLS